MEKTVQRCWQRKCLSDRGKQARHSRSHSSPAVLHSPEKIKRKRWTDCQMKAAMKAVETGLSIRKAALSGVARI